MSSVLKNTKAITINLDGDACLVLFEYLSKRIEDHANKPAFHFDKPDFAEKVALNNLLNALEPLVAESFADTYVELVKDAKAHLIAGYNPKTFGE